MSALDVSGARLYYEMQGSGPLMVLVPGANGDAYVFKRLAKHLEGRYTVVGYDRRGFSRSQLDGPQDYGRRLQTDADDVRCLIEHLGDEAATVFGASSGGVVALELVAHHPSAVRTLICFEPAAVRLLPDGQRWVDFFFEIYDLYKNSGMQRAREVFREQAFAESDRLVMARATDREVGEHGLANAAHWFEHELRQYPAVKLDLAALRIHADRIVLAVGRESRGYPCYEVNVELGKALGRDLIELPGGHTGYVTQPLECARELLSALG